MGEGRIKGWNCSDFCMWRDDDDSTKENKKEIRIEGLEAQNLFIYPCFWNVN